VAFTSQKICKIIEEILESLTVVDALKNRKSGRFFILLEDQLRGGQVRVINATGHAVVIPRELFETDAVQIAQEDFAANFEREQILGLQRFRERQLEQAHSEQDRVVKERTKRSTSGTSRTSGAKTITRGGATGGIVDRWQSPKLTFYRHRIGPLRSQDRFAVTVSGVGEFVMSRDEFEREFNEVIMSKGYRQEGFYSYSKPPEHAMKFLRGGF
jgi:hypothetical protein